jgi:Protein of unknown function (DUF3306)
MSEGFFSRWSRRKQEAEAQVQAPLQPLASATPPAGQGVAAAVPVPAPPEQATEQATEQVTEPVALPSLDDVRGLTPDSDFQPFMQRGVGAEVRNAAMKKLFADPHFNVMDGLDIYIDDYSQPDPLPADMLRQMASAQFMKLVPQTSDAGHPQDPDGRADPEMRAPVVAQSLDSSATAELPDHDHTDLQLQPDPAAANPRAEPDPR